MIILGVLLLNQTIYLESSTLYTHQFEIFCERATIQYITKIFKFETFSVHIQKALYHGENITGNLSSHNFTAEAFIFKNPDFELRNICLSLCGLKCPQTGVFLQSLSFSDKDEKIKLTNGSVRILGKETLAFKVPFLPKKLDLYGKSPGFSNPNLSLSKKHGLIAGGEFFIPFSYFGLPNIDLTLSSLYFWRKNLIFGGIKTEYERKSTDIQKFDSELIFNSPSLFSLSGDTLLSGNSYHIGIKTFLTTSQFLSTFPANVQIAGLPFSFYGNEINIYLLKSQNIKFSFTNKTNIFSDHLTYYNLFSENSANIQTNNITVSTGILSHLPELKIYPFTKADLSYKGLRLLGRLSEQPQKLYSSTQHTIFDRSTIFHPPRLYEYLYEEIFISPSFLSLAYEWWIDSFNLHIGGSSLFPNLSLVPEAGLSFPLPLFALSTLSISNGLLYSKNRITPLFLLSINYLPRNFSGETSFLYFSENFLGRQSFFSNISISNLRFLISFNLLATNSADTFLFFKDTKSTAFQSRKVEYFVSADLTLFSSAPQISLSYISYIFMPIQFSAMIKYNLPEICSEIYISGIYSFTQKGEPRINFGVRTNL